MPGEEAMAEGDAGSFAAGRGDAGAGQTALAATDVGKPDAGELIRPDSRYGGGQVFQSQAPGVAALG